MRHATSSLIVVATAFVGLVAGVAPAAAAEMTEQGTTVISEGVGLSAEEALKSAFQNAVRQVVGAYLDAETLIENDRIVTDRVLTYSNGFISGYQVLEETRQGAIWKTRIASVVERGSLLQRLSDHNLVTNRLDGRGLAAETLQRREAERSGAELLARTFSGFPANVLRAEVFGRPNVIDRDEKTVQLRYRVRLSVDPKLYSVFQTRLVKVLEHVAMDQGGTVSSDKFVPTKYRAYGNEFFADEFLGNSMRGGNQPAAEFGPFRSIVKTVPIGNLPGRLATPSADRSLFFVVHTGASNSALRAQWRWFETQVPFQVARPMLQVAVRCVDVSGSTISQDAFTVGPRTPALSVDTRSSAEGSPLKAVISPYMLYHRGDGYRAEVVTYAPDVTLERRVNLSLSELSDAERIQCHVTIANR